jgi:dienelactone hydrolase
VNVSDPKPVAVVAAALLLLGVAGCGRPGSPDTDWAMPALSDFPAPRPDLGDGPTGRIYFATSSPFDFDVILREPASAERATGVGTLFLPETGAGPFPSVVLLHGSGGIESGREMAYGRWLADHGIAAFALDYYLPRGVTPEMEYMLKTVTVTEFDIVADAYAALEILSTHPDVDATRIGVAGFSYGGVAARLALDRRIHHALAPGNPGFALHVDFYGPCHMSLATRHTNGAKLLTLRGSEDASNDLRACRQHEDEIRAAGSEVEAHVYEGAGHSWDSPVPRRLRPEAPYLAGCEIVYDAQGRAFVGRETLIDLPRGTPRAERFRVRAGTIGPLHDCTRSGYLVGRDDETRALSDADLLAFLYREFGLHDVSGEDSGGR